MAEAEIHSPVDIYFRGRLLQLILLLLLLLLDLNMRERVKSAGGFRGLKLLVDLGNGFRDSPRGRMAWLPHLRHGADVAHVLDVDGEVVGWGNGVAEAHVGVQGWGLRQPFVAGVGVVGGVVEGALV